MRQADRSAFVGGGVPHGGFGDADLEATLLNAATTLSNVDVTMVDTVADDLLAIDGAHRYFDAITWPTRRLGFWPGAHDDWPPAAIEWTVHHLDAAAAGQRIRGSAPYVRSALRRCRRGAEPR